MLFRSARTGGANDNHWIDDLNIVAYAKDASSAEAGQALHFEVTTDNAGLFASGPAISADGTLSYRLAAGVCGEATVTAVLKDNGGTATCGTAVGKDTSAPYTFKIRTALDTIPPRITCPGNLPCIKGTSPAGAVVTFAVSATDNCCLASVACVPPSGSLFPVGQTAVTCTAVDGAGNRDSCTFAVCVTPPCEAPTAVINAEQLIDLTPDYEHPVLISCNWWNSCLVSDGWTSSDPQGGPLTYLWFLDNDPVPVDAGPVSTNCIEVGVHTITLVVNNACGLNGTTSKTIEVVTGPLGIELLIEKVNESSLPRRNKRELTQTLRVALRQAGDEKIRLSVATLDAFEKKVRALPDRYAAEKTAWIRWSQAVSDGMTKCIKLPRKPKHEDNPKDPQPPKRR